MQVSTNIATASGAYTSEVRNAAAVLSQGVEGDFEWLIGAHLQLSANVSYLNAYYLSYANAGPTVLQAFEGQKSSNDTGWPTAYDPRWSSTLTAAYSATLPREYRVSVEAQSVATSAYYINIVDQRAGAYVALNGRLTLEKGAWAIDVIGKNLSDRNILLSPGAGQTSSPGTILYEKASPRNVVLQMRYRW
jgi:outer membrane receptor for ferrienterochelin and colicin